MTATVCPLAAQAEAYPGRVAVLAPGESLTYQALEIAVGRLTARLRSNGIGQGSRVAIITSQRWEEMALILALWRLRAIACLISSRFPPILQQQLANQLRASLNLSSSAIDELLQGTSGGWDEEPIRDVDPELAATILYSSGTTQHPKAIVHNLAAHWQSARGSATNIALQPGDRWLASLPFYHIGGLAIPIRTILAGATFVIPRNGAPLGTTLVEQRVTHCSVVSTQLRRLVQQEVAAVASLKCVLLGGGPCPQDLLRTAITSGLPLRTTYGLTEMASQVTATPDRSPMDRITTAGQVLPGRQLRIENGEILVRGETLCLGYDHNGTIASVVDSDGWFPTGDAGSLDQDGFLTVAGRLDEMFISGGENIHPEAIEQCLLSLPGVGHAIVVPIENADYGHRPVAFIQLEGGDFVPDQWERELRQVLPPFMIPDAWFPWPNDVESKPGLKTSRQWLKERARRETRS